MKKYFVIGINILIATAIATIYFSSSDVTAGPPEPPAYRKVENNAFHYGERLNYDVKYSFITAGTGYFYILPQIQYRDDRKCYDIRFSVRSLKSLEFLYKVKDTYSSIMDVEGIFPYEFEQHIREGNFKRDFKATFDQVNHKAKVKKKAYDIPAYCHDIVSAFYYVRTKDLGSMKKGSMFKLKNFFKDKTYDLAVKIHGKQTVEVTAGKFKCTVIEPLVVEGGLFKSEGKILIWVTDDELKIPVKVATKILIGSVSAELKSYSGLKGKLTSKVE